MSVQFVKSSAVAYGPAPSDEERALSLVELCGRTAYKSEEKITGDSAKKFVLMLKSHGHLSVLEHSNVVLRVESDELLFEGMLEALRERLGFHRLLRLGSGENGFFISGNFRAWIDTLEHLKERKELHDFFLLKLHNFFPALFSDPISAGRAPTLPGRALLASVEDQLELLKTDPSTDLPIFVFRFVCDRGITHEVVRHRVFSFTQESTRYVNYGNRGMVLILPEELYNSYDDATGELESESLLAGEWRKRAEILFHWYGEDLSRGLRPEIARDILPNLLKSELFVSGRWSGWKHFIMLRESSQAHPRIRFLAKEVRKYFEGLGLEC